MAGCGVFARWQGAIAYRTIENLLKPAGGASVTIYRSGTLTAATLFADRFGLVPKGNPFVIDANGWAEFYVDESDCHFDMKVEAPAGEFVTFSRAGVGAVLSNAAAEFNVIDFGVVGDGVTDDEPAMNDMMDTILAMAGNRPGRVIFPKGDYLLGGHWIPDGEGLVGSAVADVTFIGDGARLIAKTTAAGGIWTTDDAIVRFRHETVLRSNFEFEGFDVDGQAFGDGSGGPDTTRLSGFRVSRMARFRLRDCRVRNLGSGLALISDRFDAVLLGDAVGGARAQVVDCLIDNLDVDSVARNAVSGLDVETLKIRGGRWVDCRNSGLDVEPNLATQFARDVLIDGTTIKNAGSLAVVITPGSSIRGVLYPDRMEGATVRGVTIYGDDNTDQGILFENWINCRVEGGEIHGCREWGFHVKSSQDVAVSLLSVSDMVALGDSEGYGVRSDGGVQSSNVRLIGCTGYNLQGRGARLLDLDGGALIGCTFDDYDNGAGGRAGVTLGVLTGGMVCRRVALIGVAATNGAGGRGIDIESASVLDTVVIGDIALGNASDQFRDLGTRTVFIGMKDRTDRLRSVAMSTLGGYAPPGLHATNDRTSGEITVPAGGAGTVSVVNNNFNTANNDANIFFTAKDAAAVTVGVQNLRATRTATGFDVSHPGGGPAVFGWWGVSN